MHGEMYSLISVATSLGQPNILCHSQNHTTMAALGPSPAGQEGRPAEIQALISMQGHSKGPSWLYPVLRQPAGEYLTQGFRTGLLAIIDGLRLHRSIILFLFCFVWAGTNCDWVTGPALRT